MKGVVFTEFLEMTEQEFGLDVVDQIIEQTDLPSKGAYTAVGTYDYLELVTLVQRLSQVSSVEVPELIESLGKHLFSSFVKSYPFALAGVSNSRTLLSRVEGIIHVEVKKLHPNAELPSLEFKEVDEHSWTLLYRSKRPFADLCEGLVKQCITHFGELGELHREDLNSVESEYLTRFQFMAAEGVQHA